FFAWILYNYVGYQLRYNKYKDSLLESVMYAREHGSCRASVDGEEVHVREYNLTAMYTLLWDAGMGKTQSYEPEGDVISVNFGDGSRLQIWEVRIDDKGEEKPGICVKYTNKNGGVYQYDHGILRIKAFREMLCLENNDPWKMR
ncbi:MAG: hypothetical protein IJL97_01165, partial [Lachnospiraceae bacterium]|nr:hypothetical protein [Lachnospiraceae bacterium]